MIRREPMGGSGGGGRDLRDEELRSLEETAKESLREGSEPQRRNCFISFDSDDLGEVNLLRAQSKNENSNLEFNDYSLKEPFDSQNAEYIRRGIRERMKQCSVTIVYITEKTAGSRWVDWEIRESAKLGKGVIAVHKGDYPPSNLPKAVKEHNIKVIPWKQELMNQEIDKAAKNK
jgi:hypothetical protein